MLYHTVGSHDESFWSLVIKVVTLLIDADDFLSVANVTPMLVDASTIVMDAVFQLNVSHAKKNSIFYPLSKV